MTAAVLLVHVTEYAAAVRSHLADLADEQVEELTDGLEADLAEAMEDWGASVASGQVPDGSTDDAGGSSVLDLTRRFGPAADYAAELRAAAGLSPTASVPAARRGRLRERGAVLVGTGRRRWLKLTELLRSSPAWQPSVAFVTSLRALWWVLRGWLWFVLLLKAVVVFFGGGFGTIERLVPRNPVTWSLFAGLLLLSIAAGRGLGADRRRARRVLAVLNMAALLTLPWAATVFRGEIERRLASDGYPVYVETAVYQPAPPPEDGVRVDGQLVSNLFVFDAQGNPLHDVQIFDDRGRPVRTTYDKGQSDWWLPGVDGPWAFLPAQDVDGRQRWNVYPLSGAPVSAFTLDDATGQRTLSDETAVRTPPAPFAKAPAVVAPTQPTAD